ncbi:MAG: polyribonucleotide nucleotidyltransferase [Actinomycetia bacterium]|nr:polyribonucleotide nucleotidyltransferase [Actinomycetes bacterium]
MPEIKETFELFGKTYSLETGELAKQAGGAVVVRQDDTMVLVTACVGKEPRDADFFPLTVDFEERMYAAGKIPGGFLKREGRASERATLTARMIDRPLRSAFDSGFRNEVQVVATVLSADQTDPPDVISIMGASAALMAAGAPFGGPLAGVRVARDESGAFIVNPTYEEAEASDLDLVIGGSVDAVYMIEAGAHEISEDVMLEALAFAQKAIGEFCAAQERFLSQIEITPLEIEMDTTPEWIEEKVFAAGADKMNAALHNADKLARMDDVAAVKEELTALFSDEEIEENGKYIKAALKALEKKTMRAMVLGEGERADGRSSTEIRPISVKVGYVPQVHGSGLFTRGQTQVLSIATLGMLSEWQRLDTIDPIEGKRYMHHYNFPPFCTGETGFMRGPKRRDIGHGALAERALAPVLPIEDDFPYAIRVVSEVLESNGSSSMASVCGSTLALMDAGVLISAPGYGIAIGLIKERDQLAILSDIQGLEDFLGDMDFKVAGTPAGITALQMDNKAAGLSVEILTQALRQANEGRAFILSKMQEVLPEPRAELSENAPRIITIKIPVDKIREVIGTGGKVIRAIQEETGAQIDINEDGTIYIASKDTGGEQAARRINLIVKDPEVGEVYDGRVVSIQSFGAFVELLPGKDGLLHISRVANGRVGTVDDVLSIGDEVKVEVLEIDSNGKISLDRLDKPDAPEGSGDGGRGRDGGDRRGGDRRNNDRKPRRRN